MKEFKFANMDNTYKEVVKSDSLTGAWRQITNKFGISYRISNKAVCTNKIGILILQ
nr:MAG TPA: polo-box domain protein [Caudoviricetes sp.]